MGAAKKLLDKKMLKGLIPLNALSAAHLDEISRKAVIETVRAGRYVFKAGDRDYQSVYVLEGKVEMLGSNREVLSAVTGGSEAACHPLAHKQPRELSVRAAGGVTVLRVDSSLLDVLLTWDESSGYDVVEIDAEDNGDWMTRMLQSPAFLQLPPSNIHQLLMRLEPVGVQAGDLIVKQDEDGDYFYIVKSGRMAVSRKESAHGEDVLLAELGEGDCFGEEALVSGARRNATVTMLTEGSLMRLSKGDFDELLRTPLVREVDYLQAHKYVDEGAMWLDVRLPVEFDNQHIHDSRNLPLSALREQIDTLDGGERYILCCDTGRRSASAAFILSQRGLDIYTLRNGLMDVPSDLLNALNETPAQSPAGLADHDAEIIPFENDQVSGDVGAIPRPDADGTVDLGERPEISEVAGNEQEVEADILRRRVESLEHVVADSELRHQELSRQLDDAKHASNSSASESGDFEKQRKQLELELARVREDYQQLGQRTSAVAGERDAISRELDGAKARLGEIENQLALAEKTATDYEQQLEEKTQEMEALRQTLESAIAENAERDDQFTRRATELEQQLATREIDYESELRGARDAMARAQTEVDNLKREQQRLLNRVRKTEETLDRERHDHESEVHRLHKEMKSAAGASAEGLAAELETLQAQVREAARLRDDLEINLGERSAQLEDAQARMEQLEQQLKLAQQGASEAEQQLVETNRLANEEMEIRLNTEQGIQHGLREALEASEKERNNHQETITVVRQELEELRDAYQQSRQALEGNEDASSHLADLKSRLDCVVSERDELQSAADALKNEVDQLRAEAEVHRGLEGMLPRDDAESAQSEALQQAAQNVEVAVRLRAQAEMQVDELRRELEQLKQQQSLVSDASTAADALIPSLDDDDPFAASAMSSDLSEFDELDTRSAAALPDYDTDDMPPSVAHPEKSGVIKGLLAGMVIGVVVGAGFFWLQMDSAQIAGGKDGDSNGETTVAAVKPAEETQKATRLPVHEATDSVDETPSETGSLPSANRVPVTPRSSVTPAPEAGVSKSQEDARSAVLVESAVKQPAGSFHDRVGNGRGPLMIRFRADEFVMGSSDISPRFDERPQHRVRVDSFAISAHEVTFSDYDAFARATGRRLPYDKGWGRAKRPVIDVSWEDAQAYTQWLSRQTGARYRLPTEAEWEFVARSGTVTRYWWGDDIGENMANCFDCGSLDGGVQTSIVGSFSASPWGVYDMAGNVREWVQDCYTPNYSRARGDSRGVESGTCAERVVRGGAYTSPATQLRAASRDRMDMRSRLDNLGFRVVREY